jgi:N-acetylglutamate synthase-like GNAT family acetyltransferase
MTFVDLALARRIELAECSLCSEVAAAALADGDASAGSWPIAGGAAVFAGPASPCNKLVGLGLDGTPDDGELARIEQAFDERGTFVRAEVTTLAGETAAVLAARGYALQGFEYVLGRRLDRTTTSGVPPFEVTVCAPEDHDAWIDALVTGFAHGDEGTPHEEFPREALVRTFDALCRTSGYRRYLVREGGTIVAAASLRIHHDSSGQAGVAQLCGSATLPAMRRRGMQTALVSRRLSDAVAAGCDLAFVTTAPCSKSQENMMRAGFELLYARAIFERPRPDITAAS